MNARKTYILLSAAAALIAWNGYVSATAVAQEREPGAGSQQPERRHRPRDVHGRPGPGGERCPGLRLGRLPGADLFQRLPEDEGPLTPDERIELVDFLRTYVPKVHGWLEQLRERQPAAFEQRLQEAAPRLRQLRRIFERDPQLGRNLVRYSENRHRMGRARRAWRASAPDPAARQRIHDVVRRMTAQNLRIEAAVLEDRANELEQQRDERIEADVERWLSDDVDVAGEPEEIRELVQAWRAAQEDDEREALADELRRISSGRVDREVARLRNRAARLRENAVEEVDRRMQRWREQAERGPRSRPAAKHERGHRRADPGQRGRLPGWRP